MNTKPTAGAWRYDPFTHTHKFVGKFIEPPASELAEYAYETTKLPAGEGPINHGTQGGYRQHRRRGEGACEGCKEANNLASKIRKDRKKAA